MVAASKKAQEIWETTIDGTTWVHTRDPRTPDTWVPKKVGGRGSKRITLTVDEREFNQELIPYENSELDPFTNGTLVRISPKTVERGENELTDDDLIALLTGTDDDFAQALTIESEILMRRLHALARVHTTMVRFQAIQAVMDDRYRIGKTQRVVREMYQDSAKNRDADI